jgi:hypothetical protein
VRVLPSSPSRLYVDDDEEEEQLHVCACVYIYRRRMDTCPAPKGISISAVLGTVGEVVQCIRPCTARQGILSKLNGSVQLCLFVSFVRTASSYGTGL